MLPLNVVMWEDGVLVELSAEGVQHVGRIPAGYLYVDGVVGDVGQGVLRDRKVLAEEGVVVVVVTIDIESGVVITGPEIITRGWVYAPEAEYPPDETCHTVSRAVDPSLRRGRRSLCSPTPCSKF